MTHPDDPPKPLTTDRLEAVRAAATDYLRECADDPPMSEAEQVLALSVAGVMPSRVHGQFGNSDQARLAWVVASCCFVRLELPENGRQAAARLYALLDELEMFAPAAWAETYAAIEQLMGDDGARSGDDPDVATDV